MHLMLSLLAVALDIKSVAYGERDRGADGSERRHRLGFREAHGQYSLITKTGAATLSRLGVFIECYPPRVASCASFWGRPIG
jgi:hypothetical protein